MRTTATWIWLGVMGLALAACQPKTNTAAPPVTASTAAPAATPVPATATAAAMPPESVAAVTQALTAAQAFNAKTLEDIAGVAKTEKRIHDLAGQASDGATGSGERQASGRRVGAARTEAEAAHAGLGAQQAAFRLEAQTQTDAVAAAQLLCAASPEFAAAEPCVTLAAEQAAMAQNIAALSARFVTAETSYQKDRVKLDEAAATMALGIR